MHDRFHGRREAKGRLCNWPDCEEPGEFRAPGVQPSGFDGPGSYRWFCLEHVRAFNAGYDYFAGMTSEEILRAQSPLHGWERETRAFSPTAGAAPEIALTAKAREQLILDAEQIAPGIAVGDRQAGIGAPAASAIATFEQAEARGDADPCCLAGPRRHPVDFVIERHTAERRG